VEKGISASNALFSRFLSFENFVDFGRTRCGFIGDNFLLSTEKDFLVELSQFYPILIHSLSTDFPQSYPNRIFLKLD
jgi:hypothetical protein